MEINAEDGWPGGGKHPGAALLGRLSHRAERRPDLQAEMALLTASAHRSHVPRGLHAHWPLTRPGPLHQLTQLSSEAQVRPAEGNVNVRAGQGDDPTPLPTNASPNQGPPVTFFSR